jgi:osmotically-inducible protein OsmY
MYKSNRRLQHDVLDEIEWDASVDASSIGVAVVHGVVSLFGDVSGEADNRAAIAAAERVPGVRVVAESLRVNTPGSLSRTDADIARDIASLLARRGDVPDSLKARVENGWLWLEGEVDSPFQRAIAERAIRDDLAHIRGLRGMTNDVIVARPATPPAILHAGRALMT